MASISSFLLEYDLEISAPNLMAVHAAFSGADPQLARKIEARRKSAEDITQAWMNEITGQDAEPDGLAEVEFMMSKLETELDNFHQHTIAARTVTTDYGSELEQHVNDLEQVQDPGNIVSNFSKLAKEMLVRTRKAEADMRKSEEEAKALRQSLARAKRDAEVDHLTGLPNRRAFEAQLERDYREAKAAIEPLSVAFCDIDHFKRVNDTHGHDAGDRVIKLIADTLGQISDDSCHVARHGGEEFVMLFRLTPKQAAERLDEAREKLANRRLINRATDEPFGQITFSGGVASVFAYPDPREALKAADEALYQAKEGGRNRIEIA